MTASLSIRPAVTEDATLLTDLALRSKAYWGYSQSFMDACRDELTVTQSLLEHDDLSYWVASRDSEVLGFYALARLTPETLELDALFVDPSSMGQGVGKALMEHAQSRASALGGEQMIIHSDPHAVDFYITFGATQSGTLASGSIPGRNLPLLTISLSQHYGR
ncbi:MAG: GNAT family N-acetyltransferase [Pseudomonadota bacterium]